VNPANSPRSSHVLDADDPAFRRIVLFLTLAGFAVSLNIRITDPLLPPLAAEFLTTPGKVAIVSVFYAVSHGFMQLAGGPVGDRYGKLRVVTLAAYAAAGATAATSLAGSIPELGFLRLLSGATAAIIFPLAFAWVGDTVAYEKRQVILARIFGGAMLGTMMGQAVSGIIADYLGWRAVFILAGAIFLLAAAGLTFERGLRRPAVRRAVNPGIAADLLMPFMLLKQRLPRFVLGTCAAEGFLVMSAMTFMGAYLHDEFDLSYSQIGLVLALFGAGGLFYTLNAGWLIRRLGERELVTYGGLTFSALFLLVAFTPVWQTIPILLFACGASLLMLHNTLQLRASQMAPETRGAAMSAFAASFFVGQLAGVALGGLIYDRFGGSPLIAAGAVGFAVVAMVYRAKLRTLDQNG
jgi:MFS transporter, YNFM family, putative membrane transport protein